jgi:hypothetical protein
MRRRLAVLLCLLALATTGGVAQAGGAIRGYVLLPAQGRLEIVDVAAGRPVGSVSVPVGSGPVAASIDGSRVLVANTRRGVVTQIDGIYGRRSWTLAGLGRPVEVLLVPHARTGLVRPRYAVLADARGWIGVLDLALGELVRRIAIRHPIAMAMSQGQLWVASSGRATLTQIDLGDPTRPRVVARPRLGVQPVALAIDSDLAAGVDGISSSGRFVQLDAVSLARTPVRALEGPITQLVGGDRGVVWAATSDGRVLGVRALDGRVVGVMRVPRQSRLATVGGWLAATHGRSLSMFPLGTTRGARTIRLPGDVGDATFAVLP